MKWNSLPLAALTATLALPLGTAVAADKPAATAQEAKPAAAAPDEAEMMKKWEAAATPGAAHKALDPMVGEWNIASKWWMAPGAPPMETKGQTTKHWIFGGRFLQDDYNGEFMGSPMKGLGLTGYDNLKKKYTSFWIDAGGTAMYTSLGTVDASGKVFTFRGKMDDAMTGEKGKAVKYIIRLVSADKHVFEIHEPAKGKDSLVAEMVYTRK